MKPNDLLKKTFAPRGFKPMADGKYPAKVVSVRSDVTKYGDSIHILFEVVSGRFKGNQIGKYLRWGRVGDQLCQWVEVLTGNPVSNTFDEYDLRLLIGRDCLIGVEKHKRIYDIFPLEDGQNVPN